MLAVPFENSLPRKSRHRNSDMVRLTAPELDTPRQRNRHCVACCDSIPIATAHFRATDRNHLNLVVTGDGVNFEIPMEERDARLRPNFKNLQRARSQSAVLSWDHVHSPNLVVHTAAYQRWSSVGQLPEAIDQYGVQTNAERTLRTLGVKTDVTHVAGRHVLKGGVDLVLLRPHEDLYYLSQPWIDFTHLPDVNESHVHFRGPNLGVGLPRPVVFTGEETGGQASVFVQDKMQMTSALTIDMGLRFPERAFASGLIPRFGFVDGTDGGRIARESLAVEVQRSAGPSTFRATGFMLHNSLNLFSNFTYFLTDLENGDQFEQAERRVAAGGRVTYRRLGHFLNRHTESAVGAQIRQDRLDPVGLYGTVARGRLSTPGKTASARRWLACTRRARSSGCGRFGRRSAFEPMSISSP